MTRTISDAELDAEVGRALRAVSAAETKAGFQAAVLARAERAAVRRIRRRRRGLSAVAAGCAIAVGLAAWNHDLRVERASRRAALIDEHRRLQSDLDELRALADRRSRISLGGDESTDLYLDLAKIPAAPAGGGNTPSTTRSPG